MSDLTIFQFGSQEIRFVGTPEKPEWVATDVVAALYPETDRRNYRNYLRKVNNKWKGHKRIMTLGGEQEVVTLLEPGLYYFLGRSNSEIAIAFQEWLYEIVLPSIRKTGKYELPQAEEPKLLPPSPKEISEFIDLVCEGTDLHRNLIAGRKVNAIIKQHPQYAIVGEVIKPDLIVTVEEELLNPTKLGIKLGDRLSQTFTPRQINKLLIEQGFQIKNPEGKDPSYLPTEKGKQYGKLTLDTAVGRDKTVQSLKWYPSVLDALEIGDGEDA